MPPSRMIVLGADLIERMGFYSRQKRIVDITGAVRNGGYTRRYDRAAEKEEALFICEGGQ